MSETRVLVIVDPEIPADTYQTGGAVVLSAIPDDLLGFAVLAKPLRVHDEESADRVEAEIVERGGQFRRIYAPEVPF